MTMNMITESEQKCMRLDMLHYMISEDIHIQTINVLYSHAHNNT